VRVGPKRKRPPGWGTSAVTAQRAHEENPFLYSLSVRIRGLNLQNEIKNDLCEDPSELSLGGYSDGPRTFYSNSEPGLGVSSPERDAIHLHGENVHFWE